MKKLLFIAALVLGIAAFVYFHFSAPQVLDRRLSSLLDSLSFGTITLEENADAGKKFAAHFAEESSFTGAGNSLVVGTSSRDELRTLYVEQLRAFTRNCKATTTGNTDITLKQADLAEMETTITLTGTLHGNTSFERSMPVRFTWKKIKGKWLISAVQLKKPVTDSF